MCGGGTSANAWLMIIGDRLFQGQHDPVAELVGDPFGAATGLHPVKQTRGIAHLRLDIELV